MMDSPRSERFETTRFSTPVSELDDHRNQTAIQPSNINSPIDTLPRRGTMVVVDEPRADRPIIQELLHEHAPIHRDFEEQAIADDDNEDEDVIGESELMSPRRGFARRVQKRIDEMERSRDRSDSSRSSSPPNSVDAFAEPRRRERANTFGSKAPSDLELNLQRTISGGTHRRRPTFSNHSIRQSEHPEETKRAEEDVCFPQVEDESKTFKIDFEEMEEFVAENTRGRPVDMYRRNYSFSSQGGRTPTGRDDQKPALSTIPERNAMDKVPEDAIVQDLGHATSIDMEKLVASRQMDRRQSVMEPNRFSFFSSEIEQTIHAPELGDLLMPGESFRDLFELPYEAGAWWLDVMNPTSAELEMFQKAFGIHRLTAEDIERQEIREKVELFKQYYFVCFRSFFQMDKSSEDYLEPVNVYMVVFREGILTFTYSQSPHAAEVRKRIGNLRNYINLTADWICYAMVDNIVDSFGPVIRTIEIETDQIEDQVFISRGEDWSPLLRQIGLCRKKVMHLMRLLGGKADVIKGFAKRCNEQYLVTPRGDIGLYLGDIQDHVVTMMSNLGHFEKMLSRSHSNYLAQISIDSIAQGTKANEVLGKITVIATVLVPMNLICGLFGMNVPVPGGVSNNGSLAWFFGILGFIASIVAGSLIIAKRLKYI